MSGEPIPATAMPNRRAAGAVLTAVCGSALVVNANTPAVTTLIPSIRRVLNAPVAPPQRAVTGYSLQGATVIVTSGALGDVLGRRKVFLAGLAPFVGSCALIALSANGVWASSAGPACRAPRVRRSLRARARCRAAAAVSFHTIPTESTPAS